MSNKLVPFGYVYKTTNKINGKIYIGQHKGKDFDYNYIGSGGKYFQNALNKYGRENFECFPLYWCWTKEELDNKEIKFIAYFNSTNRNIGYNQSIGGDGCLGYKHSKEIKKKMSLKRKEYFKNNKVSEETRKKLSDAGKGRIHSEKTKEKMRLSQLGQKRTSDQCKKMSEWQKGKKMSKKSIEKTLKTKKEKFLKKVIEEELFDAFIVFSLREQGYSLKEISNKTNISFINVTKYIYKRPMLLELYAKRLI